MSTGLGISNKYFCLVKMNYHIILPLTINLLISLLATLWMGAYSRDRHIQGGLIKLSETCHIEIQFQYSFFHNIKIIV